MNDAAAGMLGISRGSLLVEPPGGLAPGLTERAVRGIVRRGNVLAWMSSSASAASPGRPRNERDTPDPVCRSLSGWTALGHAGAGPAHGLAVTRQAAGRLSQAVS
jgi:hypothetical protein